MSEMTALDKRMKSYEPHDTFVSGLSVIARLDGRSFSKFTAKLPKPYSKEFGLCMQQTAEYLTNKFNVKLAFTQSDEITLLFDYTDTISPNMMFGGRCFKMHSILAAAASAKFSQCLQLHLSEYIDFSSVCTELPEFDCRCYQVPTNAEAANVFLWRAADCVTNSIQMLARAHYTHKECLNKSTKQLLIDLETNNIVWDDYPEHFKHGSYFRRRSYEVFSEYTNTVIKRHRVELVNYHQFRNFSNHEQVVFHDVTPVYKQE